MGRKLLFIAINFGNFMEQFTKVALLLFFSSVMTVLTLVYQPFLVNELNFLELYSNISVYITIFSGAIYVQGNISESFQAFLFIWILLSGLVFIAYWLFLCSKLFFFRYSSFFKKIIPSIANRILKEKTEPIYKRTKFMTKINLLEF